MKRLIFWIKYRIAQFGLWLHGGKPGDWIEQEKVKENLKAAFSTLERELYDADKIIEKDMPSPFKTFCDGLKAGTAKIRAADVMLLKCSAGGRVNRKDYKQVRYVHGAPTVLTESVANETHSNKSYMLTEAALKEDSFDQDYEGGGMGMYDANNYNEYIPIMGGPFYRQMYLTDMLSGHQKSFEAFNHNPLARRILNIIRQYSVARGFKVASKDNKAEDRWNAFAKKFDIVNKIRKGWITDYLIFGEFFLDTLKISSIDPSTIWEIITNPEDIDEVFYYYQSFPTAFQMFTGFDVAGVKGSAKVPSIEYILRQLPYDRVFHLKSNGASAEKRGRPQLYPILGWLKRFKDYWNAEMVKAWVQASYAYDITVKGSDSDISTIAASNDIKKVPAIGSSFVHNEAVTRQILQPISSGGAGKVYLSDELLAIISACVGVPKEFLNTTMSGGGSRATALVSSEPFTKVIEEVQADITCLLRELARICWVQDGDEYKDELEFIFPSLIKDTTKEMLGNISGAELNKYISHKRAATMVASELDITIYDYDEEMETIKEEQEMALGDTTQAPEGRFGADIGKLGLHGQDKVELKKDLSVL